MPRLVAGVQTWEKDGSARGTARLDGDDLDFVSVAPGDLVEHVSAALAGRMSIVSFEHEGRPIDCTFAPLLEHGRIAGAVAVSTVAMTPEHAAEELRAHIAMEELVNELSTRFVGLAGEAIDPALGEALRAIGEFAGVDRAYIFRFLADGSAMTNTHEWCSPGIEPQIHVLQRLEVVDYPWWSQRLRAREVIHVPDVDEMPAEAVNAQAVLRAQGIQSVLAIPMICEDSVIGFVGFDAVVNRKVWKKRDIALLRIAGEIFAGAIERARADRKRHLLEAELVQARSLESVARLAGGIAHDFNNLLAVILNYATLLKRQINEPSQRQMLDELFETARSAAELTRQLLLVGRRDVAEPVLLDLSSVVRSLEPLIAKSLGEGIDLRLELDEDLEIVLIGLAQIEQVILNLVVNARDAMPRGGSVTIRTENIDISSEHAARFIDVRPGRRVRLRVADTGIGMAPEVAARAFEPFFTTKGPGASGLGLATLHGIVKHAGGHVVLTAKQGAGTIVDVYLPTVAAASRDAAAPSAPTAGKSETVLVVDDSRALRRVVCAVLEANSYRPIEAASADEALSICEARLGEIDAFLTDVRMPGVSGRDLAMSLREKYGITRVLYMSGYDEGIVTEGGSLAEGARLIQKPFDEGDLLCALRGVLEGARATDENKGFVTG